MYSSKQSPSKLPGQVRPSLTDDIEHLRVHLGLDRVVLMAHSAGTRLALACAAQFTLSVARLVLITPPAAYLVDEPSDAHTLIGKRRGDLLFEAAFAALEAGRQTVDDDGFNAWQQESAPAGYATWGRNRTIPRRQSAEDGRGQ
ncbi:alpha/beta hydrolase [Cryobacterium sp. TMT2-18-3]|uniref:alpha/beta fold hydrolase n=1 Tax=unclassified Cryobacterium TaxID=2649013 RepID=UPI00106B07B3|nr:MULTISPECIES: alpha/beta hydrolase [unclassified Cryobacterium]TFC26476.1 alpha/beta hydrolase [Cryobacterium sp. TMT2-18-2]TFC64348.1 alpha/beta hydrolase [Cryobacterium sp. TMT2-18-3]